MDERGWALSEGEEEEEEHDDDTAGSGGEQQVNSRFTTLQLQHAYSTPSAPAALLGSTNVSPSTGVSAPGGASTSVLPPAVISEDTEAVLQPCVDQLVCLPEAQDNSSTGQQQQWAAINFARDVVLQGKLGSGAFATVYAALWLRPPASALHSFGPVLEVALPAQAPGRGRSLAQGGVETVSGVHVAVKVVPLMGNEEMMYSARSLDPLKQELQVCV
jgi:hypothetical protein